MWISSARTMGAVGVDAELVLGVGQDQPALGRQRLAAGEQGQGACRVTCAPLRLRSAGPALEDLGGGQRLVVAAVDGLAGGGDDRLRQRLVVAHAVGQAHGRTSARWPALYRVRIEVLVVPAR